MALATLSVRPARSELPTEWIEAFSTRDPDRVSELLVAVGNELPVDDRGATVLHVGPRFEKESAEAPMFARLLAAGADIDAVDELGATPLHLAASYDCPGCVSQLLLAGVDTEARRQDGRTPLHHAGPESQALLIARGADIGARDLDGRVPLHTNRRPTPALLAAGVNVTDDCGLTPLHYAALDGDEVRVAWLLDHGADPKLRTTQPYLHFEGGMAPEFDPGHRFKAGQRPYDLVKWQHDRSKWATSRYSKAKELLAKHRKAKVSG